MPKFKQYIGIDYSGASTAEKRNTGLRVFKALDNNEPEEKFTPDRPENSKWNWNRNEIASWLIKELKDNPKTLVGLDHGFSFPISYMTRYNIKTWDAFLEDFCTHYPLYKPNTFVDMYRFNNPKRTGTPDEFRLTEKWTASAKSVFRFDVQGAVAKSTHTGIPWLYELRKEFPDTLHFWPFDGWKIPAGKSVIAEAYPALYKRRYPKGDMNSDQYDAYATAKWLQEADINNRMDCYCNPPLNNEEKEIALLEGWILGVM